MCRILFVFVNIFHMRTSKNYLSNPKPKHTAGGTVRDRKARRLGAAGTGRTGRRPADPPRTQLTLLPPRTLKTIVPGHVLHETGLQKQIGDGTLVRKQERRPALVSVMNILSSTAQPLVMSSVLHWISFVRAPEETSGQMSTMPCTVIGMVASWANRPVGVPSCPAPSVSSGAS